MKIFMAGSTRLKYFAVSTQGKHGSTRLKHFTAQLLRFGCGSQVYKRVPLEFCNGDEAFVVETF